MVIENTQVNCEVGSWFFKRVLTGNLFLPLFCTENKAAEKYGHVFEKKKVIYIKSEVYL